MAKPETVSVRITREAHDMAKMAALLSGGSVVDYISTTILKNAAGELGRMLEKVKERIDNHAKANTLPNGDVIIKPDADAIVLKVYRELINWKNTSETTGAL